MSNAHPIRARVGGTEPAASPARSPLQWAGAGVAALLLSGAALASIPASPAAPADADHQWRALGIAPMTRGGTTGLRMIATDAVEPIDAAPVRAKPFVAPTNRVQSRQTKVVGPLRIRGRVGDGLYWSLRSAGASPDMAAQYLSAIATEIDVGGDVLPGDGFDLILSPGPSSGLLYAGLDRSAGRDLQILRWTANGRSSWIDAANADRPAPMAAGMAWPVSGRITSYFGNRMHPILRFTRFHAGLDFGARWGSPIVATADGQVVRAAWAGGYGRQVRIAHGGGLVSSYSHMSDMAVAPGSFVHRGQVIGYVGSSGLSTGPHLHYEVRRGNVPVNPLSVRFVTAPVSDPRFANAVKARLKALLSVGTRNRGA